MVVSATAYHSACTWAGARPMMSVDVALITSGRCSRTEKEPEKGQADVYSPACNNHPGSVFVSPGCHCNNNYSELMARGISSQIGLLIMSACTSTEAGTPPCRRCAFHHRHSSAPTAHRPMKCVYVIFTAEL
jgi:hypothetical protein